ncbi:hypothetical protein [Methylobacterium sp. GXF4]|uniref:hypothetical protein n=1 Tax=Methylobacterium sp. GXF4 TaxID=1096546 RepID=UPI001FCC9B07|nr:hypothetical protein [Methylobacterium sp. GXF4]
MFLLFGWLLVGLLFLGRLLEHLVHFEIKLASIPGLAWIVLSAVLWNPIWRAIWRKYPFLNKWFPDLNGEWNVELHSNWSRQEQLLLAANAQDASFDMRHVPEGQLEDLSVVKSKAEIKQTWWSLEMSFENPNRDTPIERSDTIVIEPIPGIKLQPPAICYFYKQSSSTANVSDDVEFYGAARLIYDYRTDRLEGVFWTARMWQRAMNTAGKVVFTRLKR